MVPAGEVEESGEIEVELKHPADAALQSGRLRRRESLPRPALDSYAQSSVSLSDDEADDAPAEGLPAAQLPALSRPVEGREQIPAV